MRSFQLTPHPGPLPAGLRRGQEGKGSGTPGLTSQVGQTNVIALGKTQSQKSGAAAAPGVNAPGIKNETGYEFEGIDALNFSFGKAKFIDLQDPRNNFEQTIGIKNCVVPQVRTGADLAGLVVFVDLRSNHFFDSVAAGPRDPAALRNILSLMGGSF